MGQNINVKNMETEKHECDLVVDLQPSSRLISREGYQTLTCLKCGRPFTYRLFKLIETADARRFSWEMIEDEDRAEKIRDLGLDKPLAPRIPEQKFKRLPKSKAEKEFRDADSTW